MNEQEKINDIFNAMLNNPHFAEFVKSNENKTTEEIAIEYDIKIDLVKECIKS